MEAMNIDSEASPCSTMRPWAGWGLGRGSHFLTTKAVSQPFYQASQEIAPFFFSQNFLNCEGVHSLAHPLRSALPYQPQNQNCRSVLLFFFKWCKNLQHKYHGAKLCNILKDCTVCPSRGLLRLNRRNGSMSYAPLIHLEIKMAIWTIAWVAFDRTCSLSWEHSTD